MSESLTSPARNALLCPACGFDLRGTPGDRCGECGAAIDRAQLLASGFPWVHRQHIGRMRAYVQTAWLVSWRSKRLKHEAIKPQDWRDGRSFARTTAALLSLTLLAGFLAIASSIHSTQFLNAIDAWRDSFRLFSRPLLPEGVVIDLLLPWSAGATLWPAVPIALVAFSIYLTGLPRSVLDRRRFDRVRRECTTAIAYYCAAPLAMLSAGGALIGLAAAISAMDASPKSPWIPVWGSVAIIAELVIVAAIALYFIRIGQWSARINHRGIGGALLAMLHAIALSLFGLLVIGGLFVWLIGLLRIIIGSW